MKSNKLVTGLLCAGLLAFAYVPQSYGISYGFENITNNELTGAATGEAQLFMDVEDGGKNSTGRNLVKFIFTNKGLSASSITDIYFDDGTLLFDIVELKESSGVDFSIGASPKDLPGGDKLQPKFETSKGFSTDSNPPAQPNGINPDEYLEVLIGLKDGKSYLDTISALANPIEEGGLRVGIHVQGFAGGGSESFINRVPDGGTTLTLLGMSLAGLGLINGRRSKA